MGIDTTGFMRLFYILTKNKKHILYFLPIMLINISQILSQKFPFRQNQNYVPDFGNSFELGFVIHTYINLNIYCTCCFDWSLCCIRHPRAWRKKKKRINPLGPPYQFIRRAFPSFFPHSEIYFHFYIDAMSRTFHRGWIHSYMYCETNRWHKPVHQWQRWSIETAWNTREERIWLPRWTTKKEASELT